MQRKKVSSMTNGMIDGMKNRLKRQVNERIDGMKARRRWDETNEEEKEGCGGGGYDEERSNGRKNEKTSQSIAYGKHRTRVSLKGDLSDFSFSDSENKRRKRRDGMRRRLKT